MLRDHASEIVAKMERSNPFLPGVKNNPQCSPVLMSEFCLHAGILALQWIDATNPQAWYRGMIENDVVSLRSALSFV